MMHFCWLDEDRGFTLCGRYANLVPNTSNLDDVSCKTCLRAFDAAQDV